MLRQEAITLTTTSADSVRAALDSLLVLPADDISAMPWIPLAGLPGVETKELWRLDGYVQALIRVAHGATTPGEPHLAAHHHVWVVSGEATVAGRHVARGSYLHVPPGVRHAVEDVGPDGFVFLQMHRPHAPREAELLLGPQPAG
jgi:mannose-6-phosphate isomerase-like protein (cupin superfamily)